MMSPNTLERATSHFRVGYRACYRNAGSVANLSANPYEQGTFAWSDWHDGYCAAITEIEHAQAFEAHVMRRLK